MAHEFKPGDLALVMHAHIPDNLGKVVTLLRPGSTEEIQVPENGGAWLANPARVLHWVVSGEFVARREYSEAFRSTAHAAFPATSLMPLKGDEQPAQVHQSERVQ